MTSLVLPGPRPHPLQQVRELLQLGLPEVAHLAGETRLRGGGGLLDQVEPLAGDGDVDDAAVVRVPRFRDEARPLESVQQPGEVGRGVGCEPRRMRSTLRVEWLRPNARSSSVTQRPATSAVRKICRKASSERVANGFFCCRSFRRRRVMRESYTL